MRRLRRLPSAALAVLSRAVAGALGLPIVFLTPPVWKRLAEIPHGAENKDVARTRAIARWPASADLFARKCDVDRAEACLIALAGLRREGRNV
jgi:crossover junction endodeoxyribonuclease RuvC